MSESDHADCAACGSLVMKEKNLVPVGYRSNEPAATEAVQIVLCDGCRFGILKELLSGGWSYSAHKVSREGSDDE